MTPDSYSERDILDILKPESELERLLIVQPEVQEGLLWGEPRYGHPEGKVLHHVPEIFENFNRLEPPLSKSDRERLRIIALLHDVFKYREDKSYPRDWSKHHGILARRFAENFIVDKALLDIIELHDEAYYCWRLEVLEDEPEQSSARFQGVLKQIAPFLQLYYVFFKCDTATGDKTQAPVKWFERKVRDIQIVSLRKKDL